MRPPVAVAFLALVLIALASCGGTDEAEGLEVSGHVEATEVRLATKIPGRLESLRVREGDRVSRGQEVARVETVDLDLALDAATADLARSDAELRLAESGAREEEIAEAEARVRLAEADLAAAERDFGRMQALLDRGSGAEKARDDARTRRDIASATLDASRQTDRKLRAGTRAEEIAATKARRGAAAARVAQLEQQVRDATVVSPVDGVVTEKVAEAGEFLAIGAPIAVVTDLSDAWLTVFVPEPSLGSLRIGGPAVVVTDAGERREGRIAFIASMAEFTPKNVQTKDERVKLVYRVKVALENRDGLFKPGMPAVARLDAEAVR